MKKLINLIALVMLVSTNVLTPFSYAGVETPEVIPENEMENVVEVGETPEINEEIPEINEETPELVPEEKWELEQENQEDVAPENVLPNAQNDVETPTTDETEEVDTESDEVVQSLEEASENEIKDEEGKIEELEKVREAVVMAVIPDTTVTLLQWQEFNSVIKTLANGWTYVAYTWVDNNIQSFQRVDIELTWVTTREISKALSEYPVYAWFSWWVLYYSTKAEIIQLNENPQNMFQNFGALTELDLSNFDTSDVTSMWWIFAWCSKLEELNLSWWDFRNCSNASLMMNMTYWSWLSLKKINMQDTKFSWSLSSAFASLNKVEEIDLSWADVRNVTNMWWMFSNCSKLEKLNLNWWYFTWSIGGLFAWLTNLKEISLKWVDMKWVTDMWWMFSSCSSLTWLDLSSFDTSKVTNMWWMLGWCNKLEELNLSWWNFSKSSSTPKNLFWEGNWSYCSSSCNLKKLNLTNVKFWQSMNSAFMHFKNLEELKLDWIDTSDVTDMRYMFKYCSSNLTGLDLSNFDTSNVTDMSQIFAWCYDLEMLNLSWWDFHHIPSYGYANWLIGDFFSSSPSKLRSLDMTNAKFSLNMSYAFRDLVGLEELKLEGVVTSWVTNMNSMFYNCKKLTWLNLGSFDTSNVTDMSYMFFDCSSIRELDLSNFNTSKVTNMSNMFSSCGSLRSLNLDNWDLSELISYGRMFSSANSLEKVLARNWVIPQRPVTLWCEESQLCADNIEIDVSGWDLSNVKNLSRLFGNSNAKEIKWLDTWNTSNITWMYYMFGNCKLTWLDLSSWDTSNVTDMTAMFNSCSNLENLNLDNWSFAKNPKMSDMFWLDNNLKNISMKNWTIPEIFTNAIWCRTSRLCATGIESVDVSYWDLSQTKVLDWLFWDLKAKEIKWLNTWDTSNMTVMSELFSNCSNLTWLDLSTWDTSNVTTMGAMFSWCNSLTWLDLSNFDTSNVASMGNMFKDCSKLEDLNLSWWDFRNINNASLMMSLMWWTPQSLKKLNMTNTKYTWSASYAFGWLTKLEELNLDWADTRGVTNMNAMFNWDSNLTWLDLSSFDISNVTSMWSMFWWCNKLENLNLSGWDFRNVSNASLMSMMWLHSTLLKKLNMTNTKYTWNATYAFGWLNKLEELSLDWADTSNITSMNAMFNWDSNLKKLDLSSFDTSNVTSMWAMFYWCSGLNELDLTNFNTPKVTAMGQMFFNTPNLKTIYASENFVTTALSWDTSSKDMFSWTTSVVWWNWTKFDPNYIDKEYAKIDKVWQTWYFTDKNAITVKFINILDWIETISTFKKWQKLTPPSVNGYHAVWWYLDEAMTQKIDLNKWVDSYSEIYVKYERNGSSGWWGGGWGWSTKPDTPKEEQKPAESPQSDASSWTNVKEPESNTGNKAEIQTWSQQPLSPTDSSPDSEQIVTPLIGGDGEARGGWIQSYSPEFQEAYKFAHENGITTKDTIQSAQMNGKLTRIAMAKMLSQYAINVLWKTPDTSKTIKFKDVTNKKDADYDNWVTLAYQLWIMWQNMPNNRFRPNDEVSRAEFATALSRLLYQTTDGEYKSTKEYYIPHMAKLYNEWIISNTDPSMAERRWYVMIMLMRSAK